MSRYNKNGMTLDEIAAIWGMSKTEVRKLEQEALESVRIRLAALGITQYTNISVTELTAIIFKAGREKDGI